MASLLSPRRTDPAIALEARVAERSHRGARRSAGESAQFGWLPVALAGGLVSSVAGWVLVAGTVVLGWLSAEPGTLAQSLQVGTQLWLLSNGIAAQLGSATVTLIPWGATAVFAFLVYRSAALAGGRVHNPVRSRRIAIATVTAGAYLTPVGAAAVVRGNPWASSPRFPAVAIVICLAAAWGAGKARGSGRVGGSGARTAGVCRAVIGAQLAMVVCGAALLATGLISQFSRVAALTGALDAGIAGGVALLVVQIAMVPNAVIWAGSYAIGPGFSAGTSSVVAPAITQLGLLPGLPLLGALPAAGVADPTQLWWLAGGAVSGAVAALITVRSRPPARFDQTSLVGGLSGLLSGVIFAGAAWASGGDLGSLRLTGLGPRFTPLLVMAPTTMGLAGMVVGFAAGLTRQRRS